MFQSTLRSMLPLIRLAMVLIIRHRTLLSEILVEDYCKFMCFGISHTYSMMLFYNLLYEWTLRLATKAGSVLVSHSQIRGCVWGLDCLWDCFHKILIVTVLDCYPSQNNADVHIYWRWFVTLCALGTPSREFWIFKSDFLWVKTM